MKKVILALAIFVITLGYSNAQNLVSLKNEMGFSIGDKDSAMIEALIKKPCKVVKTGNMMGFDIYNMVGCPISLFDLHVVFASLWFKENKLFMVKFDKIKADDKQWQDFLTNASAKAVSKTDKGEELILSFPDFSITIGKTYKTVMIAAKV